MPKLYAEILRNTGFRDDNWKPLASNDPVTATLGWTKFNGQVANSDGNILTLAASGANQALIKTFTTNLSSDTYPFVVFRGKTATGSFILSVIITFTSGSPQQIDFTLTATETTFTGSITAAKTITGLELINQGSADALIDYIAVCGSNPLQISQKDLMFCKHVRVSYGADVVVFRLNNRNGKYVVSTQSPVGFGDIFYLWAGTTSLNRMFGGYLEWRNPERNPSDEIVFQARGWGTSLHQILVLKEYLAQTPRQIINDAIDNFVNAAGTNYQITRSYVQDKGSSIAYLPFIDKPVWECFRQISDLIVAQGTDKVSMFVDASENLHLVPMSGSSPNWGTDPLPAAYPTSLELKKNQILNQFQRDVENTRNRVHYKAIVSIPGDGDSYTNNNQSSWGTELITNMTSITLSNESTVKKMGTHSIKAVFDPVDGTSNAEGRFFYPSTKDLSLDLTTLGSQKAPPLLQLYFRMSGWINEGNVLGSPAARFLRLHTGTGSADYYEARFVRAAPFAPLTLTQNDRDGAQADAFYLISVPVGPNAGDEFFTKFGSGNWADIDYISFWFNTAQAAIGQTHNVYVDGLRFVGARYRLAYDSRADPPPFDSSHKALRERREISITDEISKDDTTIKNLAQAELKRLWNPVLRGTVTLPIMGDAIPEQTFTVTAASADLTNVKLRAVRIIHTLSQNGYITELELVDDYTSAQPLERFRLINALLQTGHPGIKDREVYNLKTAILDPSFTAILDGYT